ncbi:MAG: S9 family peptidase [Clostridia bacterium]|nr:S9 family peptidase [Clostridia bacterium]
MTAFVPEDYGRLSRFSSLCLSPDGAMACVRYFWQDGLWQRRIELLLGDTAREITLGGTKEICPAFSGDGRLVWFLSDGRVCVYDRQTEQAREAFSLPAGYEAADIVPLAKGCLCACQKEIREEPPAGCAWEMPRVAESLRFRSDADHGFKKQYSYRLYKYDGALRLIAEGDKPFQSMALLPDESAALFIQEDFRRMNLETGESEPLDAPFSPAPDIRPVVSRDGAYALAGVSLGMEISLRRLWLDGEAHEADAIENEPPGIAEGAYMDTAPDRKTRVAPGRTKDTYFVSAASGHRPGLWRLTVKPGRLTWERINAPGLAAETAGECGSGVAVLWGDTACPPRPAFIRGEEIRFLLPDFNGWLQGKPSVSFLPLSAASQDGRAELTGFLLLPEEKKAHVPLLVWVHGGPSGYWAPGFNLEVYCAVSLGFAVLLPNPRGSTGRGNAYADPEHAFDGGAANDILCLMDQALRQYPQLDKRHASVLGGSYGGFMAAWMAGNTARFQSAVVIKAVTNWLFIHFNSSQAGQDIFASYRDFQDFLADTVRQSPVYAAGDVNIPTLIIHGEKDQQVPVENAHQYYTALKDCHPDLPVRLMLLPDCCHSYGRDALPDYIAIQRETLEWLYRYGREDGYEA